MYKADKIRSSSLDIGHIPSTSFKETSLFDALYQKGVIDQNGNLTSSYAKRPARPLSASILDKLKTEIFTPFKLQNGILPYLELLNKLSRSTENISMKHTITGPWLIQFFLSPHGYCHMLFKDWGLEDIYLSYISRNPLLTKFNLLNICTLIMPPFSMKQLNDIEKGLRSISAFDFSQDDFYKNIPIGKKRGGNIMPLLGAQCVDNKAFYWEIIPPRSHDFFFLEIHENGHITIPVDGPQLLFNELLGNVTRDPPDNILELYWQFTHSAPDCSENQLWDRWKRDLPHLPISLLNDELKEQTLKWLNERALSQEITAEQWAFCFNFFASLQKKFPEMTFEIPRLRHFPKDAALFFGHLVALSEYMPIETMLACLDICFYLSQNRSENPARLAINHSLVLRWSVDVKNSFTHLIAIGKEKGLNVFDGALEWLFESLLPEGIDKIEDHQVRHEELVLSLSVCEQRISPFITLLGILSVERSTGSISLIRSLWLRNIPWIIPSLRSEKMKAFVQEHSMGFFQAHISFLPIDEKPEDYVVKWVQFLIHGDEKWPERQETLSFLLREHGDLIHLEDFFPSVIDIDPTIAKQLLGIGKKTLSLHTLLESLSKLTHKTFKAAHTDLFLHLVELLEVELGKKPLNSLPEPEKDHVLKVIREIILCLNGLEQREKVMSILECISFSLPLSETLTFTALIGATQREVLNGKDFFNASQLVQKLHDNNDCALAIKINYLSEYLLLLLKNGEKSQLKKVSETLENLLQLMMKDTERVAFPSCQNALFSCALKILESDASFIKALSPSSVLEFDLLLLHFFTLKGDFFDLKALFKQITASSFPFHKKPTHTSIDRGFFTRLVAMLSSISPKEPQTTSYFVDLIEKYRVSFLFKRKPPAEALTQEISASIETLLHNGKSTLAMALFQDAADQGLFSSQDRSSHPFWKRIVDFCIETLCQEKGGVDEEWIVAMTEIWQIAKNANYLQSTQAIEFHKCFLTRAIQHGIPKQKWDFSFEALIKLLVEHKQTHPMKKQGEKLASLILDVVGKYTQFERSFSSETVDALGQLFPGFFECELTTQTKERLVSEYFRKKHPIPSNEQAAKVWLSTLLTWSGSVKKGVELFLYGKKTCENFSTLHPLIFQYAIAVAKSGLDTLSIMSLLEGIFHIQMSPLQKKEVASNWLSLLNKLDVSQKHKMLEKLYNWDSSFLPNCTVFLTELIENCLKTENFVEAISYLTHPLLQKIEKESLLEHKLQLLVQEIARTLLQKTKEKLSDSLKVSYLKFLDSLFTYHLSALDSGVENLWMDYLFLHITLRSSRLKEVWELTQERGVFKDQPQRLNEAWLALVSTFPFLDHEFFFHLIQSPQFDSLLSFSENLVLAMDLYRNATSSMVEWDFAAGHVDHKIIHYLSSRFEEFISNFYKCFPPYRFEFKEQEDLQTLIDQGLICFRDDSRLEVINSELDGIRGEILEKRMGIIDLADPTHLGTIDRIEIHLIHLLIRSDQYALAFKLLNGFLERLHVIDTWSYIQPLVTLICLSSNKVQERFPQFHAELTAIIRQFFSLSHLVLINPDYFRWIPALIHYEVIDASNRRTHPFIVDAAHLLSIGSQQESFIQMPNVWPLFRMTFEALLTLPFHEIQIPFKQLNLTLSKNEHLPEFAEVEARVEILFYALQYQLMSLEHYVRKIDQLETDKKDIIILNGMKSFEAIFTYFEKYAKATKTPSLMSTIIQCLIAYRPYIASEQLASYKNNLNSFWKIIDPATFDVVSSKTIRITEKRYFTEEEHFYWKMVFIDGLLTDVENSKNNVHIDIFRDFIRQKYQTFHIEIKLRSQLSEKEDIRTLCASFLARIEKLSPKSVFTNS